MRRVYRFMAVFTGFFFLFISAFASPVQSKPVTLDDIMAFHNVSDVALSPDGRFIVFVVTSADLKENRWNSDLWMVSTLKGSEPVQLTRNPKRDDAPRWSSDGQWIYFLSERGDKKAQVYRISPRGGEAEAVTDLENGVVAFRLSPDGKRLALTTREPESEDMKKRKEEWGDYRVVGEDYRRNHLYIYDIDDGKLTDLTENASLHVDGFDWSPDGKNIVFSARPTPEVPDRFHTDLYIGSSEGDPDLRKLVDRPGLDADPHWSPDGRWIAFVTGDGKVDWVANTNLAVVDPEGREIINLTKAFDESIRGEVQWSPDGQFLYFLAGQGTTIQLFRVELATRTVTPLTDGEWVYGDFDLSLDGRKIAFIRQNSSTPPDVCIAGFSRRRNQIRLNDTVVLTRINPQVRDLALGQMEKITWKAPDGLSIEGLVVKPPSFKEGEKYPLLVIIHGGPAGFFLQSFTLRRGAYPVQVFASEGYLVFMPNPRGSGNYGEDFRKMNYRDWGGGDYRDIMSGVDALIDRGWVDPERMGVMGWSYGGYMTSWIITQTDRFKAASVGAGVTNLFSMFGTTDIPPFMLAHFGKPPWEDLDTYLKHSAMYYVKNVKTPTLIQHGERDVRVPTLQGWELYTALKMRGVPVRFILYPRQPHGIREPKLLKAVMKHNLEWFNRWLRSSGGEQEGEPR